MSARKTRIYVAAPWVRKEEAKFAARRLEEAGYEITSRWLNLHEDTKDPWKLRREAQNDWADVLRSDVLILLNLEKSEGKAVEQGIALQAGIPIIAVGDTYTNVFQHLENLEDLHRKGGNYTWVPTLSKAMEEIPTFDA